MDREWNDKMKRGRRETRERKRKLMLSLGTTKISHLIYTSGSNSENTVLGEETFPQCPHG